MTRLRLNVGDQIRWDGRTWNVAVLEGASARLLETGTGAVAAVALPHLVTDPGFEVVGADRPVVAPLALLDALPDHVRDHALAWERHVREVESGTTKAGGEAPRPQYDPATRTMAQREAAKAAELTGAGVPTSVATVRRMRARYRERGVWGLVDQRTTRPRSPVGRADPRVVEAVGAVLEEQRDRSTGTLSALRDRVRWLLEDLYGPGVVAVLPQSTFNRLVHALGDGQGVLGSAVQRRWHASRPEPPFGVTVALRPGELVMMDSTPLDVLAVMADGVIGRPELTIAIDVATRAICAAVLRPPGSSTVDAAVLLAEMVAPMRMRPGWDAVLSMQRSVVPYERLLSLDERLEEAAARPVIVPETVIVDQGRVFVSASFLAACETLGVSLQPVPPANGPAKGHVERSFKSINHGSASTSPATPGRTPPSAARVWRTRPAGRCRSCRISSTSGWSPAGTRISTPRSGTRCCPTWRCPPSRCGPRLWASRVTFRCRLHRTATSSCCRCAGRSSTTTASASTTAPTTARC
ncbi:MULTISPECIES: hypothetical protein [unclassified Streptomyces]|uniref:hypothetical protein n=1 Tax=Streptomyces sp. NPDC127129 TaxID=3345373 RepID=UPI0036405494